MSWLIEKYNLVTDIVIEAFIISLFRFNTFALLGFFVKLDSCGCFAVPWPRPCQQAYNLFHATDPLAARLEPLVSARFSSIPPVNVARYTKYPLGDGMPYHLRKTSNKHNFTIRT